jgi:hypothetical protein
MQMKSIASVIQKSSRKLFALICLLGLFLVIGGLIYVKTMKEGPASSSQPAVAPNSAAAYMKNERSNGQKKLLQSSSDLPVASSNGGNNLIFPDTRGTRPPEWKMKQSGEQVVAHCKVDGKELTLIPNQVGQFQRVYVEKTRSTVKVSLDYPNGEQGQTVVVESADGGSIDNKAVSKALQLDQSQNVNFDFTSTDDKGIYRVILRKGSDIKYLEFWVGQPHALQQL